MKAAWFHRDDGSNLGLTGERGFSKGESKGRGGGAVLKELRQDSGSMCREVEQERLEASVWHPAHVTRGSLPVPGSSSIPPQQGMSGTHAVSCLCALLSCPSARKGP